MDERLVDLILENFKGMETSDLLKIWETNNKEEYSKEAFEAVKRLLEARGQTLPPQMQAMASQANAQYDYSGVASLILDLMKDLTTTDGRIPRSIFWYYMIISSLLFFGVSYIFPFGSEHEKWGLVLILIPIMFVILFMAIIVEIKRWHDLNKSGWWALIGGIPYIGWAWIIIECGLRKGTKGENRFGPDPLDRLANLGKTSGDKTGFIESNDMSA